MLERKDVLAGAATGTGKTAAFVLPVLQQLIDEPHRSDHARVLILAPTRELAFQIQHVIKQLAYGLNIKTAIITGGFSPAKQTEFITQKCDIIIGTAGRLLNLVSDEILDLSVMHGDFNQSIRRDKTRKFRQGQIKVMVATDVAARGLDLSQISHVINYDLPFRGDVYIHRIGRTGRASQTGIAINLVEPHDRKHLQRIEYHLKKALPISNIKGLEPQSTQKKAKKKQRDKPRYIAKKDRVKTEQSQDG
ncbi:UNVERIFIED_CONTAM: hypothetical protein GTU68_045472 [Idotea baltica]|nr:hypothetical protein [Idotea baltica]